MFAGTALNCALCLVVLGFIVYVLCWLCLVAWFYLCSGVGF